MLTPAALTTASMRPAEATTFATAASTSALDLTSHRRCRPLADPAAAVREAGTPRHAFGGQRRRGVRPIPLEPPVTSATWPRRSASHHGGECSPAAGSCPATPGRLRPAGCASLTGHDPLTCLHASCWMFCRRRRGRPAPGLRLFRPGHRQGRVAGSSSRSTSRRRPRRSSAASRRYLRAEGSGLESLVLRDGLRVQISAGSTP